MTRNQTRERLRKRFFVQALAQQVLRKADLYSTPGWLAQLRATFTEPFSKHPYNPSFGSVPERLEPQVERALNRDGDSPNDIQAQINTSTERVAGTTEVAAPDTEAKGFGGSGSSGAESRQLGHAPTAGNTVLAPGQSGSLSQAAGGAAAGTTSAAVAPPSVAPVHAAPSTPTSVSPPVPSQVAPPGPPATSVGSSAPSAIAPALLPPSASLGTKTTQ